ncbi:MAG: hypothetical protein JO252_22995, partial [Planctomycetaceae bacterium]|nr:hypothetical protein [Planctomycetaceae bacterium]
VTHVPPIGPGPHERARVTEGEIKAHVATALSGTPTVSLPGAGMWGLALPALDALGAQRVVLALDADHRTNPHVAAALAGAYRGLGERFAVALETWDGPKGIDDLLAAGDQPEVLDGEDAERYLARLAKRHDQGAGRAGAAGLAQDARDPRVDIDITADYHLAVDQSAAALVGHPDVYERARALVIVHRQEQDDPDDALGVKRSAGAPLITPLTNVTARTLISRRARFWGYDRRERVWVRRSPPRDVAEAVIGLGGYAGGRELTGIVESPTIRPDGSLLARPGYDPATGLLYLPNADYPEIPDAPTLGDAQRAVGELLYLVTDFPFRDDPDRAAWLALILTLIARGAIVGPTPAFLVSANVAASGKSILVATAGQLATGRPPAFDGYAVDDVEMEKRLSAVALAGDPLFLLDNAENGSAIGGPSLDRAIMIQPGGAFRARILGKTEMSPMVPWRTVIAITGNNLSTKDDALRRFVPCFLLSTMERPETRDPANYAITRETGLTLDEYVMRERPRLVAAALTILRAYVAAGYPKPEPKLTPMDFPKWELTVRRAIHYATGTDPCGSKSSLEANDETTLERRRVVAAWRDLCVLLARPEGLTVREATDEMNAATAGDRFKEVREAFPKALRPGTTQVDAGKLGYILRRHRDAVTPCGTLTVDGERHNIAVWKVSPL